MGSGLSEKRNISDTALFGIQIVDEDNSNSSSSSNNDDDILDDNTRTIDLTRWTLSDGLFNR